MSAHHSNAWLTVRVRELEAEVKRLESTIRTGIAVTRRTDADERASRLEEENAHLKLLLLAGLHTAGEETRSDGNGRVSLAHAEEVTVPPEALKHLAARGLGEWVEACCEVFRADSRRTGAQP